MDHKHGLHRHQPRSIHSLLSTLPTRSPLAPHSSGLSSTALSAPGWLPRLAPSQILGDEAGASSRASSHRVTDDLWGSGGCINSLSWSADGTRLAAAGDDTKVCIWRAGLDYDVGEDVTGPVMGFGLESTWATGHRQNIFSVKWAPHKPDRMMTAAGDSEVRILDLSCTGSGSPQRWGSHSWTHNDDSACVGVLRCHTSRVKRIAVEDSPDVFLTVSEDGTVRQHDLRTTHACRPLGSYERAPGCAPPLAHYPGLTLYTLSLSPARPHLFAVGGRNPFAYLHDRRMVRAVESDWGVPLELRDNLTQCVRRFAPPADEGLDDDARTRGVGKNTLVSVKLDRHSGKSLLVSYSGGKVYMFDIDGETYQPQPWKVEEDPSEDPLPAADGDGDGESREARSKRSRSVGQGEEEAGAGKKRGSPLASARRSKTTIRDSIPVEIGSSRHSSEQEETMSDPVDDYAEQFGVEESEGGHSSDSSLADPTQPNDWSDDDGGLDPDQPLFLGQADSDEDDPEENEDDDDAEEDEDEEELDVESEEFSAGEDDPATLAYRPRPREFHQKVPLVHPRREFGGHVNKDTVKEVAFAFDESCVVSGSDDGNLFIWEREGTDRDEREGRIVGVLSGDDQVVNVIESNPQLPCLAVSGIDPTVKLFSPAATVDAAKGANKANDREQLDEILERNASGAGQSSFGLNHQMLLEAIGEGGISRLAAIAGAPGAGRGVRVMVNGEEQDCVVM